MGQRYEVDAALTPMVRHIRWVTAEQAARAERYVRLPDGESELLLRVGADGNDLTATVVGSRTMPLQKGPTQPVTTLLVRFRVAGAYPFFGVPMHELTDRLVPVGNLWPRALVSSLAGTATPRHAAAALSRALRTRLAGPARYEPHAAPYVRRALRVATAAPRLPTVRELAAMLGGSERHLRRAFAEVVGIAPKPMLRIVRFQRALGWARELAHVDWSAVAQRAGYCDQAHLIDDFRELGGRTPTALVEGPRVRRRAR